MPLEAAEMKRIAAEAAVDAYVKDGMNVGLGTGSTAYYAIRRIGQLVTENGYRLTCAATSVQSEEIAKGFGIEVVDLDSVGKLDVTIDGADEIDPKLNLIKGLGRALLGNSGGFFLMATQGKGQIALSGFGSIQAVDVKPGQKLIVDNGHLVAWDRELDYELSINTARSGLLGKVLHSQLSGEGIVLKFKGEGKVWVCSRNKGGFLTWIFSQMPQEKAVSNG